MYLTPKTVLAGTMLASIGSVVYAAEKAPPPNVVFIYGDDVGFGDVSAYSVAGGDKKIHTPNIDKLASQGLLFTDGHCSSATCSPSRFSLLTGVWAFRYNVRILPPNAPLSIPTDILTLPKLFKKAGYSTGVIGKWHLGIGKKGKPVDWNGDVEDTPNDIGFDFSFLLPSTNDRVPCVYLLNRRVLNLDPKDPLYVMKAPKGHKSTVYPNGSKNPEAMTFYPSSQGHNNSIINGIGRIGYMWGGKSALWDDATMTETFVSEAKKYIIKNKKKPFFLYFASQCIHVPRVPAPRFRGKSGLGYRGDSMLEFDWATGEIVKTLKENGLMDNTIIIFSSDNGPVYNDGYKDGTVVRTSSKEVDNGHDGSGPYRGGKYQIYEGGTRVPLIITWKNHITPGVSHALVNQIDFFASFAKLLGIKLSADEAQDSRDTLDTFLGKDKAGLRYTIEHARMLALRMGEWKYIEAQKPNKRRKYQPKAKLFNLKTDIGERKNVIDANPEIAKDMKKTLEKFIKDGRMRK